MILAVLEVVALLFSSLAAASFAFPSFGTAFGAPGGTDGPLARGGGFTGVLPDACRLPKVLPRRSILCWPPGGWGRRLSARLKFVGPP